MPGSALVARGIVESDLAARVSAQLQLTSLTGQLSLPERDDYRPSESFADVPARHCSDSMGSSSQLDRNIEPGSTASTRASRVGRFGATQCCSNCTAKFHERFQGARAQVRFGVGNAGHSLENRLNLANPRGRRGQIGQLVRLGSDADRVRE
jgi:hypothetical protein